MPQIKNLQPTKISQRSQAHISNKKPPAAFNSRGPQLRLQQKNLRPKSISRRSNFQSFMWSADSCKTSLIGLPNILERLRSKFGASLHEECLSPNRLSQTFLALPARLLQPLQPDSSSFTSQKPPTSTLRRQSIIHAIKRLAISTGPLKTFLSFHFPPIDLIVYQGPSFPKETEISS